MTPDVTTSIADELLDTPAAGSKIPPIAPTPTSKPEIPLRGRITSVLHTEPDGVLVARLTPEGNGRAKETFVISGRVAGGLTPGEVVRVSGYWGSHATWGRMLKFRQFERTPPVTREGEVAFLSGFIQGMTRLVAERLLEETVGLEGLIKICQKTPQKLDELLPKAPKLKSRLRSAVWDSGQVDVETSVALQSAGMRPQQVQALTKFFRSHGLRQMLQQNPYEFCQVPNVGFASAERVAKFYAERQGRTFDPRNPQRLLYGVKDVCGRERQNGHVGVSEEKLVKSSIKALLLTPADAPAIQKAVAAAIAGKLLVKDFDLIYPRGLHKAESELAKLLAGLIRGGAKPVSLSETQIRKQLDGTGLSHEQADGVVRMAHSPVSILVGGPGRGKTHTLRMLLDILKKQKKTVLVLAPTGKAAKRAEEMTGQPASTIHKACGLEQEEDIHSKTYGKFLDRKSKISEDVVVVDEVSMVDVQLAFELVRRIKPGRTSLILVGDPDQLPPVGPGQFLKDLLNSGVIPIARLTLVFRQASSSPIVDGADALNRGDVPTFQERGKYDVRLFDPTSVPAYPKASSDERKMTFEVELIKQWMVKSVQQFAGDHNINPVRDTQVYAPQRSGPLGLDELNRVLQANLNPKGRVSPPKGPKLAAGFVPRVGDKVMQVRNNYKMRLVGQTGDVKVMNGQIGYIYDIRQDAVEVLYDEFPIPVLYHRDEVADLSPSYAMSIHRSQGSETPFAFIVLHRSMNPRLVNRPLIYTAWTRAKKGVIILGSLEDVARAAANLDGTDRSGALTARLQQILNPRASGKTSATRPLLAPRVAAPVVMPIKMDKPL